VGDFFERLKQRKLVQWALAYAAAAFALIQVLDIVAQRFGWPESVERFTIVAMAVGFFVTLVLAWYHGERGVQKTTSTELLILALLLTVGGAVAWRLAPAPATTHATAAASAPVTDPAAALATNPHSIAVLPFVNMSGDKDNEYFSDGISEEILNVLAQIPGLQVAARTSSFAFKAGNKEVPEIARELKVRMVLEGSVRKQGERVRITAQLIDASSGFHVWSQTYDRDLKDIFAIQDEIAKAIADELKVNIGSTSAPMAASKGTRNVQAHDAYLRGLALWQTRGEENLWASLKQFEQSAAADPTFAEAYAGMALTYVILPDWSARITYNDALARARDNAERALSLDPTLPEPYIVLGYLADGDRRRETAQALYRRAIALRPSFTSAYQWLGNSLWGGGQLKAGVAALERASVLDPRSAIIANNHGMALIAQGRYADAKALCEPILKSAPDSHSCLESTGFAALDLGDFSQARTLFARYAAVTNPSAEAQVGSVFDALQGHGDRHATAVRLATFMPQSSNDPKSGNAFQPYVITSLLVGLGEPQLALANLESWAYSDRAGMSEWAVMQLALGPLHCDPGFIALVKKIKTSDPHYATLCAGKP
jgi:TolB-like protein/Flp pilus assembly protein TadD